jgi:CheY-like chemotaxis protein
MRNLQENKCNGFDSFKSFDIILLDLDMPISDGYEACKNILKIFNNDMFFDNII